MAEAIVESSKRPQFFEALDRLSAASGHPG